MSFQSECLTVTNEVVGSRNLCTGEVEFANYGYNITRWTAILFVILFALTFVAHLFQIFKYRPKYYFLLWTFGFGALAELLGWIGRLISSTSQEWDPAFGGYWESDGNAFLMQITTLIIAPAFISGGEYVILARVIRAAGEQYSRLYARTYAIIFCSGDILSLVIQAIGGGTASAADTDEGAERGARIMVAGVILQLVVIVFYVMLLAEFWYRAYADRPVKQIRFKRGAVPPFGVPSVAMRHSKNLQLLMATLGLSTLLIFIRSIYRTIELLNGWRGPIITNEALFVVLDGVMIILALAVFNFNHPGRLLKDSLSNTSIALQQKQDRSPESAIQPNSKSSASQQHVV